MRFLSLSLSAGGHVDGSKTQKHLVIAAMRTIRLDELWLIQLDGNCLGIKRRKQVGD